MKKKQFDMAEAEKQVRTSRLYLELKLRSHQVRMAHDLFSDEAQDNWTTYYAPPASGKTHFLKLSPQIADIFCESSILHYSIYQNYGDIMLDLVYTAIDELYNSMPTTRYSEGKSGNVRLRHLVISENLINKFDEKHRNRIAVIKSNGGKFKNIIREVSKTSLPEAAWFEKKEQYLIFTSGADFAKLFADFYSDFLPSKQAKSFVIRNLIDEAHAGGGQSSCAEYAWANKLQSASAYSKNADTNYDMYRETGMTVGNFSGTPSNEQNAIGAFEHISQFRQFKLNEHELTSMKLHNSYVDLIYDARGYENSFMDLVRREALGHTGVVQVFLAGRGAVDGINVPRFEKLAKTHLTGLCVMYWLGGDKKQVVTRSGLTVDVGRGVTPQDAIKQYTVDVVVVVNLLGTGFDCPEISTVAFGYEFAEKKNLDHCSPIQKLGRGIRPFDTPLHLVFLNCGKVEKEVLTLAQTKYDLFFCRNGYFAAKKTFVKEDYQHISDGMFCAIVDSIANDVGVDSAVSQKLNCLVKRTKDLDVELYGVESPFDVESLNRARIAEVSASRLIHSSKRMQSVLLGGTQNRADAYAFYEPNDEYCSIDIKTMLTTHNNLDRDFKSMATLRSTGEIKAEMVYVLYDMGYDVSQETFSVRSIYVFTLTEDNIEKYVKNGKIDKNIIRNDDVRSEVIDI